MRRRRSHGAEASCCSRRQRQHVRPLHLRASRRSVRRSESVTRRRNARRSTHSGSARRRANKTSWVAAPFGTACGGLLQEGGPMVTVSPTTGHVYAARGAACHRAARPEREFAHAPHTVSDIGRLRVRRRVCYMLHRFGAPAAGGAGAGGAGGRVERPLAQRLLGVLSVRGRAGPRGASAACGEGSTCRGAGDAPARGLGPLHPCTGRAPTGAHVCRGTAGCCNRHRGTVGALESSRRDASDGVSSSKSGSDPTRRKSSDCASHSL